MTALIKVFTWIRDNLFVAALLVVSSLYGFQKVRNGKLKEDNKELEHTVKKLEIKADAAEVRSRPVPRDKSDILGRM